MRTLLTKACGKMTDTIPKILQDVMNNNKITTMYDDSLVVFGYGTGKNGIMITGEAPSRYGGNITGEPFTSKHSGAFLNEILLENNIKKNECFITNMVFCSPVNNDTPSEYEVMICYPYIKRIIKVLKPRIVILLGRIPSRYLIAEDFIRNKKYRIDDIEYISMFHPAYVLRQSSEIRELYKKQLGELLKCEK